MATEPDFRLRCSSCNSVSITRITTRTDAFGRITEDVYACNSCEDKFTVYVPIMHERNLPFRKKKSRLTRVDWAIIVGVGVLIYFYISGPLNDHWAGDGDRFICEEEWDATTQSKETFCYDPGNPDAERDPRK